MTNDATPPTTEVLSNTQVTQNSILGRLVESWHVQYDRVIWNLYALLFAVVSIIGKDVVVGNVPLSDVFKADSFANWYVLWATLLLISFLLWHNYTSWLLSFASFMLIEEDALYKKFWADRTRIRASMIYVLLSNSIFYSPPLLVLAYYNYDLGFGYEFTWFALCVRLCSLFFLATIVMRVSSLIKIRHRFLHLIAAVEMQK